MSGIKNQFNHSTIGYANFPNNDQSISKLLGNIPIRPDIFLGRSHCVDDIHNKLINTNHFLFLVNGIGGIGKTTIASQYYYEYLNFYSHLIWILPKEGILEAVVTLADSLNIKFDKKQNLSKKKKASEVLRIISDLKKPVLMVIDNANNIDDLDENFQLLRQLTDTHILITSRVLHYQNLPNYRVNSLDKNLADKLFKFYYKNFKPEEQKTLDRILSAIEYNTLVIELLSKNLNEFNNELNKNYPLNSLLNDIQNKGVLQISKSKPVESDYKFEKSKPEEVIKSMYDISEMSNDEKKILVIFSLLPSISFSYNYLKDLTPSISELDIKLFKLSTKGWIDYDNEIKSFKVHPIVSEIVRNKVKPIINPTKRVFDILFSLQVICFILTWLTPLLAILIKLDSKGPIFYKQKGLGVNEKKIGLYKFRSLSNVKNKMSDVEGDLKVTRVGNIIRKTNIDELPLFINVLFGEMSIIGPKPQLNYISESSENKYKKYMSYAKPGITGLAQVNGYSSEIESKEEMKNRAKFDIYYIENWSIFLDLKILFKTFLISVQGEEIHSDY